MTFFKHLKTVFMTLLIIFFIASCTTDNLIEETPSAPDDTPVETPILPSETIEPLSAPQNLNYAYHTLSWDTVLGATHYTIITHGTSYQTQDTSFVFKDLPNGAYQASVRANNDIKTSLDSETLEILIDINQEAPSIITASSIPYDGLDMIFIFSLLGGQFVGLSGNNIASNDYSFSEDTLYISNLFIESILNDNPERSTVILAYQIQFNDNTFIGYIFINIT